MMDDIYFYMLDVQCVQFLAWCDTFIPQPVTRSRRYDALIDIDWTVVLPNTETIKAMKQLSNFLRPTVGAWSLRTHLAFSPTVPDQIAMSCCKCASCSRNRQLRAYSTSRGNQIGRGRTRSLPSVPSLAGTYFLVSVSFLPSFLPFFLPSFNPFIVSSLSSFFPLLSHLFCSAWLNEKHLKRK